MRGGSGVNGGTMRLEGVPGLTVRAIAFGPGMVRMVTHLDVDDAAIDRATEALHRIRP